MSATHDPLELDDDLASRLDRAGLDFLAGFYELAQVARPDDVDLLTDLAMVLTRTGRFEEGLAVDRRIVALRPRDSTAYYNLACSLCLVGQLGAAIAALAQARDLGWSDFEHARRDPDLEALQTLPEFAALLGDEAVDD